MSRIKAWYNNLTFQKKVFLSHLAVSLIPVIILGMFCYCQTRSLLIKREREVVAETLMQSGTTLNAALELYGHVMEHITWNANIRDALADQYQNNLEMYVAYRDVFDPLISQMKSLYPGICRLTIYSSNESLNPHGDILVRLEEPERFGEAQADYNIHWRAGSDGDIPGHDELELFCRIYDAGNQEQNVVCMSLDYSSVFQYLSGLFGDNYGVMISGSDSTPVYSYASLSRKAGCGILTMEDIAGESECLEDYVLEQYTVPATGWTMYLYRPIRVVSAAAMSITVLILGAVVICLLIIFFLSLSLSRRVVWPLSELVCNIEQIEEGNLTVMVKENSGDEIGQLIRSFSRMVERLDYMVNEVYKSKIAQQQYELKALQSQINPHVLYNSLSLINWKAIMADQTEISEMAQLLSTFYRTTLNKGKSITKVKNEWENTCSYIRIQRMMHSGKFDGELHIEESMMEYEMLNLLLQPLVENAIVHGLDHKEGTGQKKLWVSGTETEDALEFEVRDNGCGIPQEEVATILNSQSKGYGLQNVNHRLRLYYGEGYGLVIKSRVGDGTSVFMRIPKQVPRQSVEE